jgi:hypothetical protein
MQPLNTSIPNNGNNTIQSIQILPSSSTGVNKGLLIYLFKIIIYNCYFLYFSNFNV